MANHLLEDMKTEAQLMTRRMTETMRVPDFSSLPEEVQERWRRAKWAMYDFQDCAQAAQQKAAK